jgi:hypothetical protein
MGDFGEPGLSLDAHAAYQDLKPTKGAAILVFIFPGGGPGSSALALPSFISEFVDKEPPRHHFHLSDTDDIKPTSRIFATTVR